jgi:peptidoglycan hydrolase-like protein with peptidoglycan-binding domain
MPSPVTLITAKLGLSASVGAKGAVNRSDDVRRVQDALNAIPTTDGGPAKLLTYDGIAGPKTQKAIQLFQLHHFGWKLADGRVDPDGETDKRLADRLGVHGTTSWKIRRVESTQPRVLGTQLRNINSKDRFFEIGDNAGRYKVLYYFRSLDDNVPRMMEVAPLQSAPELNVFDTQLTCSRFAFVGEGTHVEFSPSPHEATIRLLVHPLQTHIVSGPLNLLVRHRWIVPTSTPGVPHRIHGIFRFVRDESPGERKTPEPFA